MSFVIALKTSIELATLFAGLNFIAGSQSNEDLIFNTSRRALALSYYPVGTAAFQFWLYPFWLYPFWQ